MSYTMRTAAPQQTPPSPPDRGAGAFDHLAPVVDLLARSLALPNGFPAVTGDLRGGWGSESSPAQALEAQRTGLVQSAQETRPRPVREASPRPLILRGARYRKDRKRQPKQVFRGCRTARARRREVVDRIEKCPIPCVPLHRSKRHRVPLTGGLVRLTI